ncbi:pimeloyl-ACP methyl ester carboxylesterase [Leifsonia sp. EB41]
MRKRPFGRTRRRPGIVVTFDSGAGEGIAVLLLHGIGVSSRYFHRLAPVLAEQGRTIAVHLPGFGAHASPRAA